MKGAKARNQPLWNSKKAAFFFVKYQMFEYKKPFLFVFVFVFVFVFEENRGFLLLVFSF